MFVSSNCRNSCRVTCNDETLTFQIKLLADFYQLMDKTCQVRRQIAERVLKGLVLRPHFTVSLENAKVFISTYQFVLFASS